MAQLMRGRVLRVVAFDQKGRPVSKPASSWDVSYLKPNFVRIACWGHKVNYDLRSDVVCFYVVKENSEVAIGQTLGRIALTGIASGLLKRGGGLGGALLDLSVRGASRRSTSSVVIGFKDTTTLLVEIGEKALASFQEIVPASSLSFQAFAELGGLVDLAQRMIQDGTRSLNELTEAISHLDHEIEEHEGQADQGATFIDREESRKKAANLATDRMAKMRLAVAVAYGLGQPFPWARDAIANNQGIEAIGRTGTMQTRKRLVWPLALIVSIGAFVIAFVIWLFLLSLIFNVVGTTNEGLMDKLGLAALVGAVISTVAVWRHLRRG